MYRPPAYRSRPCSLGSLATEQRIRKIPAWWMEQERANQELVRTTTISHSHLLPWEMDPVFATPNKAFWKSSPAEVYYLAALTHDRVGITRLVITMYTLVAGIPPALVVSSLYYSSIYIKLQENRIPVYLRGKVEATRLETCEAGRLRNYSITFVLKACNY